MKHNRTASIVLALVIGLFAVGISPAAQPPGKLLTLDGITINPLKSTLPSPVRLSNCIASALSYTAGRYPDVSHAPQVVFAKQVTDAEFAQLAPTAAARTPKFGVLMNLVYLHGAFKVASVATVPYILYVLDPNCEVTVITFGDESSFPALRAASQN